MLKCARPDCNGTATSSCSGCKREQYCSSDCQKLDWKVHKVVCPTLKMLPSEFQPYGNVVENIQQILRAKKRDDTRVLKHLLSYAEFQFGQKVIGSTYRERESGERITNWEVEVESLYYIILAIIITYERNGSLTKVNCNNLQAPYLTRALILLTPWLTSLDLLATSRGDSFYENQITELLHKLYYIERMMAHKAMNRVKFDAAEGHCQRCLIYSKRYKVEGEEKTTAIYNALTALCALRRHQCNYTEAATFAEEAYNLVCIAYNPVHLEVQEAAGILIDILIINGDIYNAERFSQQTYENLHAPANGINQISEEVAQSAYQLAMVTSKNKDFAKAEKLVKEALDIRIILGFKGALSVTYSLMAEILLAQGKIGDETKELFERSLALNVTNEGPNTSNTATGNYNLGHFHSKVGKMPHNTPVIRRKQLLIAKSYFEKAHQIRLKIYGPIHVTTVEVAKRLSTITNELS